MDTEKPLLDHLREDSLNHQMLITRLSSPGIL